VIDLPLAQARLWDVLVAAMLGMAAGFDLFAHRLWNPPWPAFLMIIAAMVATLAAYAPRPRDAETSYRNWLAGAKPAFHWAMAGILVGVVVLGFLDGPVEGRTVQKACALAALALALILLYTVTVRQQIPWAPVGSSARWWTMTLGGAVMLAAMTALTPMAALLQVPLMSVLLTAAGRGPSARALVAGLGAVLVLLGVSLGLTRGVLSAIMAEVCAAIFALLTATWLNSSWRWEAERRNAEVALKRIQTQLAAAERDAGALHERQRIAREIHDTIAQSLVGIIMTADRLRTRQLKGPTRFPAPADLRGGPRVGGREPAPQPTAPYSRLDRGVKGARLAFDLAVITDSAHEALAAARALVAEGARLDVEGPLDQALTSLARRFSRETGISVRTHIDIPDDLGLPLRMLAIRSLQEGLANVRKHARAAHVLATMTMFGTALRIEVADDGVGPSGRAPKDGGFGLSGLRDRVAVLGGAVEFGPRPDGRGSLLRVTVGDVRQTVPAVAPPGQEKLLSAVKVLVVDDHPIVRRGLVELLNSNPDIAVIGEAGTGEEAVRLAIETAPDVVMMDLEMPGRGGVWATGQVLADAVRAGRKTEVLVVTVFETDGRLGEAMRAGAAEYLIKASPPTVFAEAVRRVAARRPEPANGGSPPVARAGSGLQPSTPPAN
jgi:signal transduction histidine kinase/ActR/RegA family two-component response regulator